MADVILRRAQAYNLQGEQAYIVFGEDQQEVKEVEALLYEVGFRIDSMTDNTDCNTWVRPKNKPVEGVK